MKKTYLALYSRNKPHVGQIAVFDVRKKRWVSNPHKLTMDGDLIHDLNAFGFGDCYFLLSAYKDLPNADFPRNRSGEISVSDRPVSLSFQEGIALATKVHRSSAAQLANLKPAALTSQNRYIKKVTIFTESLLEQAMRHQADGMGLRHVAQKLNVNYESLRKTLRNRAS